MTDPAQPVGARIVLDRTTLVPLGVVISVIGVVFSLGLWMAGRFERIDTAIDQLDRRLAFIESARFDRWTGTDMRIWESMFARDNPTVKTPGVSTIVGARPTER